MPAERMRRNRRYGHGGVVLALFVHVAFTFRSPRVALMGRRQAVQEEANSIGTLPRARLLPEPQRTEIAKLLREYTELRTQGFTLGNMIGIIERSDELHQALWTQAIEAAEKDPHSITDRVVPAIAQ